MKSKAFTPEVFSLTLSHRIAVGLLWLTLVVAPFAFARAQLSYGITNGMFSVMGYNIAGGQNVVIPATNGGFAVRSVSSFAFQSLPITNVVFPNTLTNLDRFAFYLCRQLREVTLPASLKTVDINAFGVCSGMTNIFVDSVNTNLSSIGGVLFDKSGSNIIEYPAGRTGPYSPPEGTLNIGKAGFAGCLLSSFTFPSTLTNLDRYPFDGCPQLTNFTTHSANPAYKAIDGVLYNKALDTVVAYPTGLTNTFVVPVFLNIRHIGDWAFMDAQLTNIIFPPTLRDIGGLAFSGCQGLSSIVIPASMTNLQPSTFEGCANLNQVYFTGNKPTVIDTFSPSFVWYLSDVFPSHPHLTIFYLPGKAGWPDLFAPPQVLWNPRFGEYAFTNKTLQIACMIPSNSVVVLENCTNLALNTWQPLVTNTYVNGGPLTFTNIDTQITNKPLSLYRFRTP